MSMSYILFARWFGIVSVLLALGVLANLEDAKTMARNLIKSETGYILAGVLPIIFGTFALVHHPEFNFERNSVISLIGLAMIIAGSFRVIFPEQWKKLLNRHLDQIPSLFSLFGLMFGVALLYIGFFSSVVRVMS